MTRWALLLEKSQYVTEHRPGSRMRRVNALSRHTLLGCLIDDECRAELIPRTYKAEQEDDHLNRAHLAKQNKLEGYVIKSGLLFKRSRW